MPEPWRDGWLVAADPTPSGSRRGPRPTLVQLHRSHCWTWVYCEKWHAPMALAPLMIRWGAETSSDRLRQRARCTKGPYKNF